MPVKRQSNWVSESGYLALLRHSSTLPMLARKAKLEYIAVHLS